MEHFTRVLRSSFSPMRVRVGEGAFARVASRGGTMPRLANASASATVSLTMDSKRAQRARRGIFLAIDYRSVHPKNAFDAIGGRWTVATLTTRRRRHRTESTLQRERLSLSYRLHQSEIQVMRVICGDFVNTSSFVLAMEQHVFGAYADDGVEESERAPALHVEHRDPATLMANVCPDATPPVIPVDIAMPVSKVFSRKQRNATQRAIAAMERAVLLARAISRSARLPPTKPVGTPEDALLAREANKRKSQYCDELELQLQRQINSLKRTPAPAPSRDKSPSPKVRVTIHPVEAKRDKSPTVSAAKRERRKSREPLVLRLKEPKVAIHRTNSASAFGRDVTNVTSETTRRVVENVTKLAVDFLRQNMSATKQHCTPSRAVNEDGHVMSRFALPR